MSRQPPQDNFRDVLEYLRRDADSYGRMDERLEALETSVTKLERILLDGTREQPALMHQILEVKLNMGVLKETVFANEKAIRATVAETVSQAQDRRRMNGQMMLAVIVALISAIASMMSAYISMKGRP